MIIRRRERKALSEGSLLSSPERNVTGQWRTGPQICYEQWSTRPLAGMQRSFLGMGFIVLVVHYSPSPYYEITNRRPVEAIDCLRKAVSQWGETWSPNFDIYKGEVYGGVGAALRTGPLEREVMTCKFKLAEALCRIGAAFSKNLLMDEGIFLYRQIAEELFNGLKPHATWRWGHTEYDVAEAHASLGWACRFAVRPLKISPP